mmetsp:Transcript_9191/g.24729  ORF Transcript_9191/g.24729 Transcript_9191/m.24729 type:complete len:368 (+) Transcript_9191:985-2088(+)
MQGRAHNFLLFGVGPDPVEAAILNVVDCTHEHQLLACDAVSNNCAVFHHFLHRLEHIKLGRQLHLLHKRCIWQRFDCHFCCSTNVVDDNAQILRRHPFFREHFLHRGGHGATQGVPSHDDQLRLQHRDGILCRAEEATITAFNCVARSAQHEEIARLHVEVDLHRRSRVRATQDNGNRELPSSGQGLQDIVLPLLSTGTLDVAAVANCERAQGLQRRHRRVARNADHVQRRTLLQQTLLSGVLSQELHLACLHVAIGSLHGQAPRRDIVKDLGALEQALDRTPHIQLACTVAHFVKWRSRHAAQCIPSCGEQLLHQSQILLLGTLEQELRRRYVDVTSGCSHGRAHSGLNGFVHGVPEDEQHRGLVG